jgi:hypothetical protein
MSKLIANTCIIIKPTQNMGKDCPIPARILAKVSISDPLFTAAITPRGMAITKAIRALTAIKLTELGKAVLIDSTTGLLVKREVPKSPFAALTRKTAYWA